MTTVPNSLSPSALAAVHTVKCLPDYFAAIVSGAKVHETRRNDRNYRVGDTLHLREWSDTQWARDGGYSGRVEERRITYIAHPSPHTPIPEGYVVMSLAAQRTPGVATQSVEEARERLLAIPVWGEGLPVNAPAPAGTGAQTNYYRQERVEALAALESAVASAAVEAERSRLLALTEEQVVEEAAKAVCALKTRYSPSHAGEYGAPCDTCLGEVRAALPVLLAPEVAKREAVEHDLELLTNAALRYGPEGFDPIRCIDLLAGRLEAAEKDYAALKDAHHVRSEMLLAAEAERDRLRGALEALVDAFPSKCWCGALAEVDRPCYLCAARAALGGAK